MYGQNGFRIFDLPLIQEGSIIGIMGRNGIGKSTVISILSNNEKANFGLYDLPTLANKYTPITNDEYFAKLNSMFKGTGLQNYFTKLSKSEIKVSYKPQQIVDIPKVFKGKVIELLKKVNSNLELIEEVTKNLNINKVLDREIAVLSGGELQRVAIAACLLRENANLYVFDEITNYLRIILKNDRVFGFGLDLDARRYSKILGKQVFCIGTHGKAIPLINSSSESDYDTLYKKTDTELMSYIRRNVGEDHTSRECHLYFAHLCVLQLFPFHLHIRQNCVLDIFNRFLLRVSLAVAARKRGYTRVVSIFAFSQYNLVFHMPKV